MAKYYLYQFQTLKVISLFDLVPDRDARRKQIEEEARERKDNNEVTN